MRTALRHTLLRKHSRGLYFISPVKSATRSSHLRSLPKRYLKFLSQSVDSCNPILRVTQRSLMKEYIARVTMTKSLFTWKTTLNGLASTMDTEDQSVHSFSRTTYTSFSLSLTGGKTSLLPSEELSSRLTKSGRKRVTTVVVVQLCFLFTITSAIQLILETREQFSCHSSVKSAIKSLRTINLQTRRSKREFLNKGARSIKLLQ